MSETSNAGAGLADLGVDAPAIIFQIINFVLLFLILKWAAYGPILKMLDQRRKTIRQAMDNAKDMEVKKTRWEAEQRQLKQKTLDEAQAILSNSEKQAKANSAEMLEKAKKQQELILKKARLGIAREKEIAIAQVKKQAAELVTLATEKVLGKKIDAAADRQIIEQSLGEK